MKNRTFFFLALSFICVLAGVLIYRNKISEKNRQFKVSLCSGTNSFKFSPREIEFIDTLGVIPTIHISTEEDVVVSQPAVAGKLSIHAHGYGCNIEEIDMSIKVRGNSTSLVPKAPYLIKLKEKTSLCGLKAAKKYVLLANAYDRTLMHNSLALEMARLLDVPFTNHTIPVNVVINGSYRGLYDLTEKIDMTKASVDIDEDEGVLLTLDDNYKEKYKFKSEKYKLPVSVCEPDFDKLYKKDGAVSPEERLNQLRVNFQHLENVIYALSIGDETDNEILEELADVDVLANYLLVSLFTHNTDIFIPKSVFVIFRENSIGGKFVFAPLWDFDLAFGSIWKNNDVRLPYNITPATDSRFANVDYQKACPGTKLMFALMKNPLVKENIKKRWHWFKENKLDDFWKYYDSLFERLSPYYEANSQVWPYMRISDERCYKLSGDLKRESEELREWITNRILFFDDSLDSCLTLPLNYYDANAK